MARLRDQPPPSASRRSTRIASKASSRASSVAASDDHSKPTKKEGAVFNPAEIARRIVYNNERHIITTLTSRQKDDVIHAIADNQIQVVRQHKVEVEKLEDEVEDLERRIQVGGIQRSAPAKSSQPLRDHFLYKNAPSRKQKVTSSDTPSQQSPTKESPSTQSPTSGELSEFGDSQMVTSTPLTLAPHSHQTAPSSVQQQNVNRDTSSSPHNNAAETPRPNLLRRAFGILSSPFGTIRKLSATAQAQRPSLLQNGVSSQASGEVIGALPASRKRPAPEQEQEPEAHHEVQQEVRQKPVLARPDFSDATPTRTKGMRTPRTARIPPSAPGSTYPTPLGAISEYTEPSETNIRRPEPTPSRHRDIASVRRRRELASQVTIPRRAWDPKPLPRDPNADSRLEKLRAYHEAKDHLHNLQKDEEIKEMTQHRTKRVKIDDLVAIPHNRPGDASGTFRMYDADSDDEMEVEEDCEVRENIFRGEDRPHEEEEVNDDNEVEPSLTPEVDTDVEAAHLEFGIPPDVGKRDANESPIIDATENAKFEMAYQHWLRSGGEILTWLFEQDGFPPMP
ncbi:hypothetical protein TI39_contig844g00016 [Zymoseptoria brevis]|uniref:Uncharacterized protein n=1 Tax=Zymoseptoria brevis TaxID=1047168 RepID=A0A0F4GG99_9PEZI|nr:hypothetical protein TI39_contig844g00016 [Zymoseptoria brevis]